MNRCFHTYSPPENESSLHFVPVEIVNDLNGKSIRVNAMIDSCADHNSLDIGSAKELQLGGEKISFAVSGCGGIVTNYGQGLLASLVVRSCSEPQYSRKIFVQCFPNPAGRIRPPNWIAIKPNFEHLKQIPLNEFVDQPVQLIIGNDDPHLQISLEDIEGNPFQPCARHYRLGWTIFGPTQEKPPKSSCYVTMATPIDDNFVIDFSDDAFDVRFVKNAFMKLWDIERYPNDNKDFEPKLTPDEIAADKIFEKTESQVGKQMQYGLLWKKGEPKLENNFEMALKRFWSLEKFHESRKDIRDDYQKSIKEHVELGYWSRLNLSFPQAREEKDVNYLAHFPVIKPERTTTKIRVVHDAKAKYCGKSLNDCLLQGRKNLCDIVKVLSMFRTKPVAVTGDIKHMFLQILVRPEDRKYLRMIWRPSPDQSPQIFQASRHIFGLKSSPFISIECLKKTARKYSDKYPSACSAIQDNSIVDDILTAVDSADEASDLIKHLIEICDSIDLKIRKFASNDPVVMSRLDDNQKAPNIELDDKSLYETSLPVIKVLGLLYLSEKDLFAFRWNYMAKTKYTKSQMLSVIASLYDPLSFLAPFTVKARLIFQKIWNFEIGWTQRIPKELESEWETWLSQTKSLDEFTLERCLRKVDTISPIVSEQLHVFADASALAYSCVLYLRVEYRDGSITSRLVFCKAKLMPIRQKPSIPRAELEAAKIATRWAQIYSQWYSVPQTNVYFWSDSKTVLWWIFRENFPDVYVENRVFFITQRSSPSQWRYVKTGFNPADLATRGITASKMNLSSLWKYGPHFLNDSPESWETFDTTKEVDPSETIPLHTILLHKSIGCVEQPITHFLTSKFRSFEKVIRIVAYCKRFLRNLRFRKRFLKHELGIKIQLRRNTGPWWRHKFDPSLLDAVPIFGKHERDEARQLLIRQDQQLYLHSLRLATDHPNRVATDPNLLKLNPKMDDHRILRKFGRFQTAKFLSAEVRAPVLLGKDSLAARGIAYDIHLKNLHMGGYQSLFNTLKQRYHVIGGLTMCRQTLEGCYRCKRKVAKTSNQAMAPLPSFRLPQSNERLTAFSRIGIDHLGILHVKTDNSEKTSKRYLLVFVCMISRAIHIEITHDKSASSTIMALTRFQSRYGTPTMINSDNAANFVQSAKELDKVKFALNDKNLEWSFNPPSAAWFGGHFEIFIKMVKDSIFKALPNVDVVLTDESLGTFISEVVRVINNRPLQYVSADSETIVLTPAHILLGSEITSEILCPSQIRSDMFARYRHLQKYLTRMWKRLVHEYQPDLNTISKWFKSSEPLKIGDVVLLKEKSTPRGKWPLALVEQVHESHDSLQRIVTIRYNGKSMMRAFNQLSPIVTVESNG